MQMTSPIGIVRRSGVALARLMYSKRASQPIPSTHQHLLKGNEVTPGITKTELAVRRQRLVESLPENSGLVVLAANKKMMSNDIPYRFRQDTDFLYLTGVQQSDVAAFIDVDGGFTLFVPPEDKVKELWEGVQLSAAEGAEYFGADDVYTMQELPAFLRSRTHSCKRLFSNATEKIRAMLPDRNVSVLASDPLLHNLRLYKSEAEIQLMRETCKTASLAFRQTMSYTQVGMVESEVEAHMEFLMKKLGAQRFSFPPVVAGGSRAVTLHYIDNDQVLEDGQLLLFDGGCEKHGYASDITRTWPVNGSFSPAQREVYEAVLYVQECILHDITNDPSTINKLLVKSRAYMRTALEELGIISRMRSNSIAVETVYPHNIGHYLGMDTHDTPSVRNDTRLQSGMILTVEPGLYFPVLPGIPERYQGIGIRIEDNVAITDHGMENLTACVPKTIEDVETACRAFPPS